MLKPSLFALVGLVLAVPAASADTELPLLPRPDLPVEIAPFAPPAFDRVVEMCERFGVACSVPDAGDLALADPDDILDLVPRAQADAAKRWALYAEEWAEIADLYDTFEPSHGALPELPQIAQVYGWHHGNRMSEITELLETMQERLDRPTVPGHVLPHPRLSWVHPFNTWSNHSHFGHSGPTVIRPYTPHLPGRSVIILPSR